MSKPSKKINLRKKSDESNPDWWVNYTEKQDHMPKNKGQGRSDKRDQFYNQEGEQGGLIKLGPPAADEASRDGIMAFSKLMSDNDMFDVYNIDGNEKWASFTIFKQPCDDMHPGDVVISFGASLGDRRIIRRRFGSVKNAYKNIDKALLPVLRSFAITLPQIVTEDTLNKVQGGDVPGTYFKNEEDIKGLQGKEPQAGFGPFKKENTNRPLVPFDSEMVLASIKTAVDKQYSYPQWYLPKNIVGDDEKRIWLESQEFTENKRSGELFNAGIKSSVEFINNTLMQNPQFFALTSTLEGRQIFKDTIVAAFLGNPLFSDDQRQRLIQQLTGDQVVNQFTQFMQAKDGTPVPIHPITSRKDVEGFLRHIYSLLLRAEGLGVEHKIQTERGKNVPNIPGYISTQEQFAPPSTGGEGPQGSSFENDDVQNLIHQRMMEAQGLNFRRKVTSEDDPLMQAMNEGIPSSQKEELPPEQWEHFFDPDTVDLARKNFDAYRRNMDIEKVLPDRTISLDKQIAQYENTPQGNIYTKILTSLKDPRNLPAVIDNLEYAYAAALAGDLSGNIAGILPYLEVAHNRATNLQNNPEATKDDYGDYFDALDALRDSIKPETTNTLLKVPAADVIPGTPADKEVDQLQSQIDQFVERMGKPARPGEPPIHDFKRLAPVYQPLINALYNKRNPEVVVQSLGQAARLLYDTPNLPSTLVDALPKISEAEEVIRTSPEKADQILTDIQNTIFPSVESLEFPTAPESNIQPWKGFQAYQDWRKQQAEGEGQLPQEIKQEPSTITPGLRLQQTPEEVSKETLRNELALRHYKKQFNELPPEKQAEVKWVTEKASRDEIAKTIFNVPKYEVLNPAQKKEVDEYVNSSDTSPEEGKVTSEYLQRMLESLKDEPVMQRKVMQNALLDKSKKMIDIVENGKFPSELVDAVSKVLAKAPQIDINSIFTPENTVETDKWQIQPKEVAAKPTIDLFKGLPRTSEPPVSVTPEEQKSIKEGPLSQTPRQGLTPEELPGLQNKMIPSNSPVQLNDRFKNLPIAERNDISGKLRKLYDYLAPLKEKYYSDDPVMGEFIDALRNLDLSKIDLLIDRDETQISDANKAYLKRVIQKISSNLSLKKFAEVPPPISPSLRIQPTPEGKQVIDSRGALQELKQYVVSLRGKRKQEAGEFYSSLDKLTTILWGTMWGNQNIDPEQPPAIYGPAIDNGVQSLIGMFPWLQDIFIPYEEYRAYVKVPPSTGEPSIENPTQPAMDSLDQQGYTLIIDALNNAKIRFEEMETTSERRLSLLEKAIQSGNLQEAWRLLQEGSGQPGTMAEGVMNVATNLGGFINSLYSSRLSLKAGLSLKSDIKHSDIDKQIPLETTPYLSQRFHQPTPYTDRDQHALDKSLERPIGPVTPERPNFPNLFYNKMKQIMERGASPEKVSQIAVKELINHARDEFANGYDFMTAYHDVVSSLGALSELGIQVDKERIDDQIVGAWEQRSTPLTEKELKISETIVNHIISEFANQGINVQEDVHSPQETALIESTLKNNLPKIQQKYDLPQFVIKQITDELNDKFHIRGGYKSSTPQMPVETTPENLNQPALDEAKAIKDQIAQAYFGMSYDQALQNQSTDRVGDPANRHIFIDTKYKEDYSQPSQSERVTPWEDPLTKDIKSE